MISSIINSFRFLSFLRKHLGRIIEPLLLFLLVLEKNHNFWKDKTCPNSLYLFNCLNKQLGHNMFCWPNKTWGPNGHIQSTKVSQACVPSKSGFHAEGVRLAPRWASTWYKIETWARYATQKCSKDLQKWMQCSVDLHLFFLKASYAIFIFLFKYDNIFLKLFNEFLI